MKCPFCGSFDNKVIETRISKDGDSIRRRRVCNNCQKRFTSYEKVEDPYPLVIKKDGRREAFSREKIFIGLKKACEKRPISVEELEHIVQEIEQKITDAGLKEIPSSWIGEEVMQYLKNLDKVAYVRFASVYRQFKDLNELIDEVKSII